MKRALVAVSCWHLLARPWRSRPSRAPARPPVRRASSCRTRLGPRQPGPHRPEGRRLRGAPGRIPTVRLTNLDGSGFLRGDLGRDHRRDREPRLLADEHVPLQPQPGRVRAGDGVLLDHRGAEVHPVPRLPDGRPAPAGQRRAAAAPDQPVRHRQLVRDDPQGRDPPRQGRSRRRGGRRGDPPRVRPRDPFRAGLRVLVRRGRRDQRRLRRLLGRDRLAARPRAARPAGVARPGLRRGLGCGLVRPDRAALPAAARRGAEVTRTTSSGRSTPTGGSGRRRSGRSAPRSGASGPTGRSFSASSASTTARCRHSPRASWRPPTTSTEAPSPPRSRQRSRRAGSSDARVCGGRPAAAHPTSLMEESSYGRRLDGWTPAGRGGGADRSRSGTDRHQEDCR